MRSFVSSSLVVVGLVAAGVPIFGCSSEGEGGGPPVFPGMAGTAGTGVLPTTGGTGTGGSTGLPTAGSSGSVATTGGAPGVGGGSSGAGGVGVGSAGTGTGGGGGSDITKVVKSMGCGKAYAGKTGNTANTIQTMGTKDADCAAKLDGVMKCGAWSTPRDYYVYLPANYNPETAYSLVLEGPGCNGDGTQVYGLNNNVNNTAIRIGLTPGPNSLGHGTNEKQGCFDDKEGNDSIDWVFYENLYDKLNGELCFDRNRVFSVGNSSGSWFSNELGCKYAGDAMRPVRGVMPNTGGLPAETQFVPTCTQAGMAGMWVHETGDTTNGFDGNKRAIARAMKVNKCTIGDSYDNTMFDPFPIGAAGEPCKRIRGCDPLFPLVVCPLTGTAHGSHDEVVNPGFSTFVQLFQKAPLLTP